MSIVIMRPNINLQDRIALHFLSTMIRNAHIYQGVGRHFVVVAFAAAAVYDEDCCYRYTEDYTSY